MGLAECALINRSKQSRTANTSARLEQLVRIRKADPGLRGDIFSASRCIVTNSNRTPGYRGSRQAGRMDCHQNGHRVLNGDRCGGSGNCLMSLMLCVFLAMVLILPVNGDLESCDNRIDVNDEWRDLSAPPGGKTDNCDKEQLVPGNWYTFNLRGLAAWIPTECIKSNMCGAKVGMRVDLLGQALPSVGENITAALCGAWDVLGKYDCCVLRTTVNIIRCRDDRLVYNFPTPFDRCPVAVCTQGENVEIPPRVIAKMGEDVNKTEDSSVTDIPETTSDASDSSSSATTTADEIVEDTTSEVPTESPPPPQPFMQQTTSETSTPDVDEEQYTTTVTAETTPSISSTDAPITADVDSEGTDSTTTGGPDIVTESVTDSETSTTLVDELNTLTTTSEDRQEPSEPTTAETSTTLVYEINTLTTTSEDRQEPSEPTTAETTSDEASTGSTESLVPGQETQSDNIQDVSSEATLLSSTDLSTSELPMTSETEPTIHDISDEEMSSTTRSLQETVDKKSNDSADEAATSTREDLSDTTSPVSFSSEVHETASTAAERQVTSSTSTSTAADTTSTETTSTTTESLLETTRELSKRTTLISSSSTPTEGRGDTTSKLVDDVIINETLRFVFDGQPRNLYPVAKVQELLGEFLRRAKDKEDWTYEMFNVSKAVNYENISTYMDFRIVRRGNDLKDGVTFFEENQLKRFVSENSNMTLLTQCRASKNCQENIYDFGAPLASVFEQNAPAFTAIIVVCVICLLVLILVVLYYRFSKRGTWKAPEQEPNKSPRNSRQINGTQSPFTDAQIMKDEMVDNASASYNGSAKDGDTNLSGTWVIPLDQECSNQNTTVSITTEDTKF